MKTSIDGLEISIDCPKCSHKFKKPLGWIEQQTHFPCPACGQRLDVDPSGFRSARKAAADLDKTIRNLGRK